MGKRIKRRPNRDLSRNAGNAAWARKMSEWQGPPRTKEPRHPAVARDGEKPCGPGRRDGDLT